MPESMDQRDLAALQVRQDRPAHQVLLVPQDLQELRGAGPAGIAGQPGPLELQDLPDLVVVVEVRLTLSRLLALDAINRRLYAIPPFEGSFFYQNFQDGLDWQD